MYLIVGLGNPGEKYKNTRHNVGFMLVGKWVSQLGLEWSYQKKFNSEIAKNNKYIFAKPKTFMNDSGTSVAGLLNYFDIDINNCLVVHDDVDLDVGQTKLQFSAGSAGHHGVEDIFEKIGTKKFWRLRIGVGRPENNKFDVKNFVLSNFDGATLDKILTSELPEL